MSTKKSESKLEIDYPCRWLYKVIGTGTQEISAAVREIMGNAEYTLDFSHTSRTGKYVSFNLEVTVASEETRNFFFAALRAHSSVKMVL